MQILLKYTGAVPISERVEKDLSHSPDSNNGEDISKYFKCRSCGKTFDNLGDMQKHIMIEHQQKGDIP